MDPNRKKQIQQMVAMAQVAVGTLLLISGCLRYFGISGTRNGYMPLVILGIVWPLLGIITLKAIAKEKNKQQAR